LAVVEARDVFIHNQNYPEKDNQLETCECEVEFYPEAGKPNVWMSHIDLPGGSDKKIYVTDGSFSFDKNKCPDQVNCPLPEKSLSANKKLRVDSWRVVSEVQNENSRFWIRVSGNR
jgi:hypothetical protein